MTDLAPITFLPKTGAIELHAAGWSAVERAALWGAILKLSPIAPPLCGIGSLSLPQPGQSCSEGDVLALWQGPREWLLLAPDAGPLRDRIEEELCGRTALVADVSGRCLIVDISGRRVHDVIARGTGLAVAAMVPGAVARVRFANLAVTIHVTAEGVALILDRAFERYLGAWLAGIADEFSDE